jgi:hypothetical protein
VSYADDSHNLCKALLKVRSAFPTAETVIFQTSDQDLYGFNLEEIDLSNGGRVREQDGVDAFIHLMDDVWGDICNISWDGEMRENDGGKADISISAYLAQQTSEFPSASD